MLADSRHRDKADHVSCFLKDMARRPFVYGHTDCALFVADWMLSQGRNHDPAEDYRGTYDSEATCDRVLRSRGGLLRIFRSLAADLGLQRTVCPEPGDVAVVRIYTSEGSRHYGAVRTPSGRWAVKCTRGILILTSVKVVAAWRI